MAVLCSGSLFAQLLLGWPAHPCLWAGQNCWGSGVVGSFDPPSIPFFPLGFLLGASCAGMASLAMPALGAHYPLLFRWGTWMWEGNWMLKVVIVAQVLALCRSTTCGDIRPSCRSALHHASPDGVHGCAAFRFCVLLWSWLEYCKLRPPQ